MPSLLSCGPKQTTGVSLSALPFWRLTTGAIQDGETVYFTLVCIYPPLNYELLAAGANRLVLARVSIPVAETAQELQRVAEVSLAGGSRTMDNMRTREGFQLFRNNTRIKGDLLEACIADADKILTAYWDIREWAEAGFTEQKIITIVPDYRIVCMP